MKDSTQDFSHTKETKEQFNRESLRIAYAQIPLAMVAVSIGVVAIAAVNWNAVPLPDIAVWIVFAGLVVAFRFYFAWKFRSVRDGNFNAKVWHRLLITGAFLGGSVWGGVAVFVWPSEVLVKITFNTLVITGVVAGGVVAHSSVRAAPAAYILPAILPLAAAFFSMGNLEGTTFGALCIVYIFVMIAYSVPLNRTITQSILLRFENLELLSTLRLSKERAVDANKLKDQFVSLVSHDLRSPLTSIITMAEIINSEELTRKRGLTVQGIADKISRSGYGLLRLIDKLLDISRLDTGKIIPEKGLVTLRNLVAISMGHLSALAERKGVKLINDLPASWKVFADPDLFGEVVKNIISNAIKFCEKGDTITVFRPKNRPLAMAVTDTGVGINQNIIQDLFDKNIRTTAKGTEGEKGTGLGLPYSKDIIDAHGGKIDVESMPGKGATFYIELPEIKKMVLVVDDQKVQRELIKENLLEIEKLEVLEAEDGEAALEIMAEIKPHLLITDIDMPKMDGLELLRRVKGNKDLANIPVIVNTALDGSHSYKGKVINIRSKAFEMGADDFISKPVVKEDFIPRVKRFI